MDKEPNPYQAPQQTNLSTSQHEGLESLPDVAIKKANGLIRDGRIAVVVFLIPILALIYILRLVQWHQLRRQYPILGSKAKTGEYAELAKQYQSACSSLWFAVLLWPAVILFILGYSAMH